jgi:hypothetical protein
MVERLMLQLRATEARKKEPKPGAAATAHFCE